MPKEILAQLDQRYLLDVQLYDLNTQLKDLEEKVRQAKWDFHCKEQELVEYESGLRKFLDRLRGKQAEAVENLNREIRRAKEHLAALSREKEHTVHQINQLSREGESLPTAQQLHDVAAQDPRASVHWAKLEVRFCARMLKPLLEENEKALDAYRDQLRGARMGEILTPEQLHEIGTAYIGWGRQCAALLERIQLAAREMGEEWDIPGYFQNPAGFIASAAAKNNRLDRINLVLNQTTAVKKRIASILRDGQEV